ncbi:MAG: DUF2071 domain-containing protein [Pirellulales bacterium]
MPGGLPIDLSPNSADFQLAGWRIEMQWLDLAFLHWPMTPAALRPWLPQGVELDVWEGQAYLGIVPFAMRGIRARGCPALPGCSCSLELNLRTYVRCGGQAGVWFFSLDAQHPVLVYGARATFALPYYRSRMALDADEGWTRYSSCRVHRGAPPAHFAAACRASGSSFRALPGTLEHWLTERYCFFTVDRRGRLRRCDVRHAPWTLAPAEHLIAKNDMGRILGLPPFGEPAICHVAAPLTVRATSLQPAPS